MAGGNSGILSPRRPHQEIAGSNSGSIGEVTLASALLRRSALRMLPNVVAVLTPNVIAGQITVLV
jgi:hypothetical protein